MNKFLKIIPVILFIAFGGYWYATDNKITGSDFWKFGLVDGNYNFAYLGRKKPEELADFFKEESDDKIKNYLQTLIMATHCTEIEADDCLNFVFLNTVESYKIYVNLNKVSDQFTDRDKSHRQIVSRFVFLFDVLYPMQSSHFRPEIKFVNDSKLADVVININTGTSDSSEIKTDFENCDVDLDLRDNIVIGANMNIPISAIRQEKFSSCEAKLVHTFYGVFGSKFGMKGIKKEAIHLNAALVLEFYSWIYKLEKFPKNHKELTLFVSEFIMHIEQNLLERNVNG